MLVAHSPPWQPPRGGIPEEVRTAFWACVDRASAPEHWLWTGATNGKGPALWLDRYIVAARVAYALAHPGEAVPYKLMRKRDVCAHQKCVNPACFSGWTPGNTPRDGARENTVGGVEIPPALAGLAHIQFGEEDGGFVPVSRRFRPAPGLSAEEAGAPPATRHVVRTVTVIGHDQHGAAVTEVQEHVLGQREDSPPLVIRGAPVNLPAVPIRPPARPTRSAGGWHGHADLDAGAVLDVLLAPGTSTVAFEGGGVWIFGPRGARINEADPATAIRKFLEYLAQMHEVLP